MIEGRKRTKKESNYVEQAEARKHSRYPHPALLLTDDECMEKYGRVLFPGRHRHPGETREECKHRWLVYLQDTYPASGFGIKPFETMTEHGLRQATAEYYAELNEARLTWLSETPGVFTDGMYYYKVAE